MKHSLKSKITAAAASLALLGGGLAMAAPASAAPAPANGALTAITPTMGMGNGAYQWWCSAVPSTCRYITIRDNWGGTYRAKCLDVWCNTWRIV